MNQKRTQVIFMTSPATGRPAHNRRTAYTKTAIRRTFFELLEEKAFDKISVREICQRADINRSTFYRHYDDINALMKSIEAEFVSDIDNQIERMDPEVFDAVLVGLFDIVRDNSDLCCYMMRCGPRKGFINSLFVKNYDRTQIKWKKFFPEITDKQFRWMYIMFFNGIVSVIAEWINSDFREDPSTIVSFTTSIYFNGFRKYF